MIFQQFRAPNLGEMDDVGNTLDGVEFNSQTRKYSAIVTNMGVKLSVGPFGTLKQAKYAHDVLALYVCEVLTKRNLTRALPQVIILFNPEMEHFKLGANASMGDVEQRVTQYVDQQMRVLDARLEATRNKAPKSYDDDDIDLELDWLFKKVEQELAAEEKAKASSKRAKTTSTSSDDSPFQDALGTLFSSPTSRDSSPSSSASSTTAVPSSTPTPTPIAPKAHRTGEKRPPINQTANLRPKKP